MRPIKFRAWDKKYKVMDDDFLIDCDGKIWDAPRMTYDTPNREIAREDDDRFILMQFTGLHDKNGKEIYEGDIFIVKNIHDGDECIWGDGKPIPQTVTWDKIGFEFGNSTRIIYAPYDFEVIGNIYENGSLLNGE